MGTEAAAALPLTLLGGRGQPDAREEEQGQDGVQLWGGSSPAGHQEEEQPARPSPLRATAAPTQPQELREALTCSRTVPRSPPDPGEGRHRVRLGTQAPGTVHRDSSAPGLGRPPHSSPPHLWLWWLVGILEPSVPHGDEATSQINGIPPHLASGLLVCTCCWHVQCPPHSGASLRAKAQKEHWPLRGEDGGLGSGDLSKQSGLTRRPDLKQVTCSWPALG